MRLLRRTRIECGQEGEEAAAQLLKQQGYRIVARNWRPAGLRGEVDCIAWQEQTLCFVEVKTRTSNEHGAPQEAVTPAKQRQLSRLANAYLALHHLDNAQCRFDVVEVWLPATGQSQTPPRLALCQNAFDYCEVGPRGGRGARVF